jgi:hypothetical protein
VQNRWIRVRELINKQIEIKQKYDSKDELIDRENTKTFDLLNLAKMIFKVCYQVFIFQIDYKIL